MIDILLALAALWLLCRFLTVCCRVPAALAPLAGLSLAALCGNIKDRKSVV